MMMLTKAIHDLGPTATYAHREAEWVQRERPGEGLLTIRLWKGSRSGSRCESDLYKVEEEAAIGCMGRCFLLLNVTDSEQPDVYRCLVGGPNEHCTCTAGNCRVYSGCKHRDALKAVFDIKPPAKPTKPKSDYKPDDSMADLDVW